MADRTSDIPALIPHLAGFLHEWLDAQSRVNNIPAIQFAVRLGPQLLFSAATGTADTSTGEQVTTEHVFRIASHSKTFAATGIFQLVEAGTIRLDDTVGALVPELASAPVSVVSVRELLGHQSGLTRDGRDAGFWQLLREFPDRAQLIEELQQPRVFGANTHFHYSNIAYSVLGLIIEEVTGRTFASVMLEMLAPLAEYLGAPVLIGPELGVGPSARLVAGHAIPLRDRLGDADGSCVPPVIGEVDTRAEAAATGFWANAESVSGWVAAHAFGTGQLLSDSAKRLMQRDESTIVDGGSTRKYGLGWIIQEAGGRRLIGHSGGFPGHITMTLSDPETGLTISALTNRIDGQATAIVTGAFALLATVLDTVPNVNAEVVSPELAGRFLSIWGEEFYVPLPGAMLRLSARSIDPAAGAVVLRLDDDGALRAESKDSFGDAGEATTLEHDENGNVRSVTVTGIQSWRPEELVARASGIYGAR